MLLQTFYLNDMIMSNNLSRLLKLLHKLSVFEHPIIIFKCSIIKNNGTWLSPGVYNEISFGYNQNIIHENFIETKRLLSVVYLGLWNQDICMNTINFMQ